MSNATIQGHARRKAQGDGRETIASLAMTLEHRVAQLRRLLAQYDGDALANQCNLLAEAATTTQYIIANDLLPRLPMLAIAQERLRQECMK